MWELVLTENQTVSVSFAGLSFSNMTINAGSRIPLIKKVSNRIPTATINPKTKSNSIGCVIRTEKVAARMSPAEEITPPVLATAISTASRTECFFRSSWYREINMML